MTKKIRKRTLVILFAGILVAVAAVLYLMVAVFYYRSHFYKGTTIGGIDMSNRTLEEAKTLILSQTDGYTLTLTTRDGAEEVIDGAAIGVTPAWDGSVDAILAGQSGFAWIFKSPEEYTILTMIEYDVDALKSVLDGFDFMKPENQAAPVDASISDYIDGTGYELIPSVPGTTIDEDVLLAAAEEAICNLDATLDVEETGCYSEPSVTDDDEELNRRLSILQQYCEAKITYTVGDDVFDLDSDTYHDWFIIGDDGSVTIDGDLAREYVVSLGHTYNTCYSSRNFKTSYGETVTISGNDSDYGWKVDYDAETAQVLEEIENHTVTTRDLNYSMTAASHSSPDYGDSYVEINITAQHLFLYKDGELVVETDFVSGNVSAGNGTPSGIFGLTYKTTDATLTGATYSSHVDYWMPFNGNIGMHDASWRSKFGAAIYLRSGSHGCVNLPTDVAPTIYDAIYTNYPVIVYELPGSESEKGKAQIAAYSVIDKINAIGDVTLESEDKITAAREAYDALSSTGQGYVTNTSTLTDAEKALETLKKEAESSAKTDDKTNKKDKKKKKDKTEENEGANES